MVILKDLSNETVFTSANFRPPKLMQGFFNNIVNDKSHRLHHLLPPVRIKTRGNYPFRQKRTFATPKVKTEIAKRYFSL